MLNCHLHGCCGAPGGDQQARGFLLLGEVAQQFSQGGWFIAKKRYQAFALPVNLVLF